MRGLAFSPRLRPAAAVFLLLCLIWALPATSTQAALPVAAIATPDTRPGAPYSFLVVAGGLIVLAALANQALDIWRKLTGSFVEHPRPAETYRTRESCIAIHKEDREWIRRVESNSHRLLDEHFRELNSKLDEMDDKIMKRLDPLVQQIAANRQAIEQHLADERAKKRG